MSAPVRLRSGGLGQICRVVIQHMEFVGPFHCRSNHLCGSWQSRKWGFLLVLACFNRFQKWYNVFTKGALKANKEARIWVVHWFTSLRSTVITAHLETGLLGVDFVQFLLREPGQF